MVDDEMMMNRCVPQLQREHVSHTLYTHTKEKQGKAGGKQEGKNRSKTTQSNNLNVTGSTATNDSGRFTTSNSNSVQILEQWLLDFRER